jgi:Cu/Ag efflux protein CusF
LSAVTCRSGPALHGPFHPNGEITLKQIHVIALAGAVGAAAFLAPAMAQSAHGHDHMAAVRSASAQAATGQGEVRKIDTENRKVTLKHEASKALGMPAMTMVYQVGGPAVLGNVKVGDKVLFQAATAGGKMTITEMRVVQ